MDIKRTLETAGIIVMLVGTGAGGVWALKSAEVQSYKDKVIELEKVNKLNYPEFLANLNSASISLKDHIDTLENIKILKETAKELQVKNRTISTELTVLKETSTNKIDDLNTVLANQKESYEIKISKLNKEIGQFKAESTPFKLLPGNGISLKSGQVQVGFTEGNSSRVCKVTVNNKKYNLEAGSSVDVNISGRTCKVVLEECHYYSTTPASFELICN